VESDASVPHRGHFRGNAMSGENLAWGQRALRSSLQTLVAWMDSPSHHGNLMEGWQETGIAAPAPARCSARGTSALGEAVRAASSRVRQAAEA
jgi:uncharacterized protein YkwD